MNSAIFVEFDPLRQVFIRVHGRAPIGLTQEEIFRQTIEVIGESAWVDKNLSKMFLAAVVQMDFAKAHAISLLEAAKSIFGIRFNSLEELQISLDYE